MKKAIFALLLAGCLAASACGSKGSSSSGSEAPAPEKVTLAAAESEGSYTTEDGVFDYSGPKGAEVVEKEGSYENCFRLDVDAYIGVASYPGIGQTAKGFGEPIKEDHANGYFTDVSGELIDLDGIPTYKITAAAGTDKLDDPSLVETDTKEVDYVVYLMQYGRGDFFVANAVAPKGEIVKYQPQIDAVLGSVVFKGEPLPTETVTAENDYFKMEIPPVLSVKRSDKDSISVSYTLSDSMDEYLCGATLMITDEETEINKAADRLRDNWENVSSTQNITREKTQFLGRDAIHMTRDLVMTSNTFHHEAYIFAEGGVVYNYTEISAPSTTKKFSEDMESVLKTLTFKN